MGVYIDELEARLKWYYELEKYPEKYGYKPSEIKSMSNLAIQDGKYGNLVLGKKYKK